MRVAVISDPVLDCELITDFRSLESIAPEWNNLWLASRQSEVFQNFNWLRAAWKSFGNQLSLFTPVVYRGAEIIGILPLALKDGILQPLGSPLSDYNDVICADESVVEVMSAAFHTLLRNHRQWRTCVMDNVAAHSRLIRHLPQLQAAMKRRFCASFRCPCSTILMRPGEGIVRELSRKQSLRRHENALKKLGRLEFKHIEDRETIKRHLGTFFHQHIARRAVAGDDSHFLEEQTRRMFEALVEELDPRTMLRFCVLTLNDRPVAYHFGFEANGKFVFYQPTFNVDYWKSSPGEVLLRQLFIYAQERNLSEFDLTRGGEAYKARFATDVRDNLTLSFNHDSGLRRQVQVSLQRADGGMRKSLAELRKHPTAYRIARNSASSWLRFWRSEVQLLHSGGVSYAVRAIQRGFRSFIYTRNATVTFSIGKQEIARRATFPDNGLTVRRADLADLAVISAMNPDTCPSCRDFQERLAAGQQPYLVHEGAEPVQVWCVTAPGQALHSQEVTTLEHCWTAPWFRGRDIVKKILPYICDEKTNALITCQELGPIAQEMREIGLQVLSRKIQFRLLHWLRPVVFRRGRSAPASGTRIAQTTGSSIHNSSGANANEP